MRLDEPTVAVLISFIQAAGGPYSDAHRLIAATLLKNKIKLVYGQHTFTNYDEEKKDEESATDPMKSIDPPALTIL